eukprot:XP_006579751.1 uncharacterized protein LOC102663955 [Glycine max]
MPVPPRLLHTTRSLPRTPHILPSKNESLEAQVAFSFKSMSRILRKRELQEGNKNLKLILPWPKESQHHKLHLLISSSTLRMITYHNMVSQDELSCMPSSTCSRLTQMG